MTRKKFQRALLQQISRDWRYGRATWPTDFCQTIFIKKGKKKPSIFAEILLLKQYFNTIKVKLNQIIYGRNFCLYFCTFYTFEYIDISNLFAVIFPIPIRILKFQSESFTCYKTLPIYLSKYNENFHNFRVTVAIWISDVSLFLQCRTNIYLFFNSIANLMAQVFFFFLQFLEKILDPPFSFQGSVLLRFSIRELRRRNFGFRFPLGTRDRRSYRENLRGALSISPGNTYLSLLRNKRPRDSKLSGGVERVEKGGPMYQRVISIVWSLERW